MKYILLAAWTMVLVFNTNAQENILDCYVLNRAIYAVEGNNSNDFLEQEFTAADFKIDTVIETQEPLINNSPINLEWKNGELSITASILPENISKPDFFNAMYDQIYDCRADQLSDVSYHWLGHNVAYIEMWNIAALIYEQTPGYKMRIFKIKEEMEHFDIPMTNVGALIEVIRNCNKDNYTNLISKEVKEFDIIPNPEDFIWYETQNKVYEYEQNKNICIVNKEDKNDFGFMFIENTTQYHPQFRKEYLEQYFYVITKEIEDAGISILDFHSNQNSALITLEDQEVVIAYVHDYIDPAKANIIITVNLKTNEE